MKKQLEIYLPVLALGLTSVLIDILLRYFSAMRLFSPRAIAFSFAYGVLLGSLALLFKSKKAKVIYLSFCALVLATLGFSQSMYFSFFNDFYSFTRLSNIKEFLIVKGETAKAFQFGYLTYYVIPALYIGAIIYFVKDSVIRQWKACLISLVCFFALLFGTKFTFINKMDDPTQLYLTDDYLYTTLYNKQNAMERFGVFAYSQRDLFRIISNQFNMRDQKEVDTINAFFDENKREKITNDKTGMFEGKNIVLILAESFNTWGIDERITPNLYKMKTSGYYFSNYYSPTFPSTTIDAEFAVNTDLIPSLDFGNTAYEFSDNEFPQSIANLFKAKGYTANSFHNSTGSFYNRYQFHEALGYEQFYGSEELGIAVPDNFGYNWASDYDLFDKVSNMVLENKSDKPFLTYMITVSTHTPYDDNRTGLKENYEYVKGIVEADSQVQYYLAAAKDLDDGIGLMMERFEKEGILDDTVFVLFGDHYSYGMYHDIIWSYYKDYEGDFHRIHNVPFMIWSPNMEAETVENPCSQFEVFPTVANLFNLDYDPTYTVGNDIFNNEENIIVYGKPSSWQDNNLIYESNYIFETFNNDLDTSYVEEKNAKIIEKLNLYQKVLKQNYFGTKDYKERTGGSE